MSEEKKSIDNPTENVTNENLTSDNAINENEASDNVTNENVTKDNISPGKRSYGGSLFEKRFSAYDKLKIPVKVIDAIIIICVILLFAFFIIGAYMK